MLCHWVNVRRFQKQFHVVIENHKHRRLFNNSPLSNYINRPHHLFISHENRFFLVLAPFPPNFGNEILTWKTSKEFPWEKQHPKTCLCSLTHCHTWLIFFPFGDFIFRQKKSFFWREKMSRSSLTNRVFFIQSLFTCICLPSSLSAHTTHRILKLVLSISINIFLVLLRTIKWKISFKCSLNACWGGS